MRYGSIPAGGLGTRLQPLGYSKELALVARRAVIEHLLERMVLSGIDKIFINTSADKSDLITYLSTKSIYRGRLIFMVRERKGLFDGVALPAEFLRGEDELYFGLPDTIWYPKDGYTQLDSLQSDLALGLFDTGTPHLFDSVSLDQDSNIKSIQVKVKKPKSKWTWAIGKMSVGAARAMRASEYDETGKVRLFGDIMQDYVSLKGGKAIELANSSCLDIGVPDEYDKAEAFVKSHE